MKRPLLLGLTGSIGMGKSTTAGFFAAEGIPVWDADTAVAELYRPGGAAVAPLGALYPESLLQGGIDRGRLRARIAADPSALARIEGVVHPLVAAHRAAFIEEAAKKGAWMVLLDIPLLFETGADSMADEVLVVTAPEDVQQDRVMARPGMTKAHLATILARQMPDVEKRARAGHVIETLSLDQTRRAVKALIDKLRTAHA
ncbi:MAG: dephospho-CoA kinase [Paracoccaceae bacterium]